MRSDAEAAAYLHFAGRSRCATAGTAGTVHLGRNYLTLVQAVRAQVAPPVALVASASAARPFPPARPPRPVATVRQLMGLADAPKLRSSVQLFARVAARQLAARLLRVEAEPEAEASGCRSAPSHTTLLSAAELAALAEACEALLGVCKDQEPAWKKRPLY